MKQYSIMINGQAIFTRHYPDYMSEDDCIDCLYEDFNHYAYAEREE